MKAKLRFEIYRGIDRQFYFRIKSRNGKIIAQSEGYKRKRSAEDTVNLIIEHAIKADVNADVDLPRLVRLYRFFNFVKGKHGEPFALCDKHRAEQPVPPTCALEKISDKATEPCSFCEANDQVDAPAQDQKTL